MKIKFLKNFHEILSKIWANLNNIFEYEYVLAQKKSSADLNNIFLYGFSLAQKMSCKILEIIFV